MGNELRDHWFINERLGQRTRIETLPRETGGRTLVLEVVTQPRRGKDAVPMHWHTAATEIFEVFAGKARYRLGNEEKEAGPGEKIVMPPRVPHIHPWSADDQELRVLQTTRVSPPDRVGLTNAVQALVTIYGLAGEGKVNAKGLPNLLQLAVLIASTLPGTYIAGPPRLIQDTLFRPLASLGRLLGYRASYPQYGVVPR